MHNYRKVEQALFRWGKWRRSIIVQCVERAKCPDEQNECTFLSRLKAKSRSELAKLCFPANLRLELYWICCITSDYSLDFPKTFMRIRVPNWLPPLLGSHLQVDPGARVYPPPVFHEGHERQAFQRYGIIGLSMLQMDRHGMRLLGIKEEDWLSVFLPSHHELFQVLNQFRGAPKTLGKRGRSPLNSDRLAVMCAAWKDGQHMADEDIARKVDKELNTKVTGQDRFADIPHLIKRGRKLINDSSEKRNRSFPEFLPDSPEQITRSINVTGLRTEIDQAFEAAIARASEHRDKSSEPPINETKDVDS